MMTARQIERVRTSFAHCIPLSDAVAGQFYNNLFAAAPETRRLFVNDLGSQGRKLLMTLAAVVDALDRLETILPTVRELAVRHVRYGVREAHYAVVGSALLSTLALQLGARFDNETAAAWQAAYGLLADTMISAARAA